MVNRRRFAREAVEATIEVFHRGYSIEFPTKDISMGGVGLDSCGTNIFRPGDRCMVIFDDTLEVPAEVVRMDTGSLHLRFLPGRSDDIKYAIEIARAQGEDPESTA